MTNDSKRFDVRSPEGTLMFSVHLVHESQAQQNGQQPKPKGASSSAGKPEKPQDANGRKESGGMTESQKRYLLTILADRGFEGDIAEQQLKELFGVETLTLVGTREASSLIKRLLDEAATK